MLCRVILFYMSDGSLSSVSKVFDVLRGWRDSSASLCPGLDSGAETGVVMTVPATWLQSECWWQ